MTPPPLLDKIYTTDEAAERLRISRRTMFSLAEISHPARKWATNTCSETQQPSLLQLYSAATRSEPPASDAFASPGAVSALRSGKATIRLPEKSACTTINPCSSK